MRGTIIVKSKEKMKFKDLEIGDLFENNLFEIYLKIANYDLNNSFMLNPLNNLTEFDPYDTVWKITANIYTK